MGTIFEAIRAVGHDRGYRQAEPEPFEPTAAPARRWSEIRVLVRRVATGQPLWHPGDEAPASQ